MIEQSPGPSGNAAAIISRIFGRLIAAISLSMLLALLIYRLNVSDGAMGKAAYLASEAARYDRELAHPKPDVAIALFVLVCILFVAYEAMAWVLDRAILRPILRLVISRA